jgi:hypothetical protein
VTEEGNIVLIYIGQSLVLTVQGSSNCKIWVYCIYECVGCALQAKVKTVSTIQSPLVRAVVGLCASISHRAEPSLSQISSFHTRPPNLGLLGGALLQYEVTEYRGSSARIGECTVLCALGCGRNCQSRHWAHETFSTHFLGVFSDMFCTGVCQS